MKIIPIIYSANDSAVDLCSVSIASIIANSSKKNEYHIYIFNSRLSKKNIKLLNGMSTNNVKVNCLDVKKYINYNDIYELERYPYEIYYRMYASMILPYNKLIYLDCDTIVLKDISELFDVDLNKSIGCVADYCCYTGGDYYFNSGVLLINSLLFEKNEVRKKCLDLLKDKKFKFPDQDSLNIVCKNDHTQLHPKFNYQIHETYVSRFKFRVKIKYTELFNFTPNIVHFSYLTKPHKSILSIYNKDFWKFAKMSPYYDQLVDFYVNDPYNDVLKKSFLQESYLGEVFNGNVGLSGIFLVFFKSIVFWILFKIRGDKNEF